MALVFPKYVVMSNPYLKRMYNFFLVLTFGAICFRFTYWRYWESYIPMNDKIHASMWVSENEATLQSLRDSWKLANASTMCTQPRSYDYWYNNDLKYQGHSCLPPCDLDLSNMDSEVIDHRPRCVRSNGIEGAFEQEAQDVLFLPTRVEERKLVGNTLQPIRTAYFLPTAEALQVSMAFTYSVELAQFWYYGSAIARPRRQHTGHSRLNGNVLTVVLNSTRGVHKTVRPGDELAFTVPEIISLVGPENLLDEELPDLGPNLKPGSRQDSGPRGRVSGLQLNIHLDCYQSGQMGEDWDKAVCYIKMERDNVWAERREHDHRSRHSYIKRSGVRIKVTYGGHWAQFDPNNTLLNFVALLVLLRFPKALVMVFSVTCLGSLSGIYYRYIFERIHIGEQIGGMAARLLTNSCAFFELEEEDGEKGVSKDLLRQRIMDITEYRKKLRTPTYNPHKEDDGELVDSFTEFAWKTIKHPEWLKDYDDFNRGMRFVNAVPILRGMVHKLASFVDMLTIFGSASRKISDPSFGSTSSEEKLEVEMYLNACASSEPVGFYTLTRLFETNARRSFLETLFTPRYLKKSMDASKRRLKRSPALTIDIDSLPASEDSVDRISELPVERREAGSAVQSNSGESCSPSPLQSECDDALTMSLSPRERMETPASIISLWRSPQFSGSPQTRSLAKRALLDRSIAEQTSTALGHVEAQVEAHCQRQMDMIESRLSEKIARPCCQCVEVRALQLAAQDIEKPQEVNLKYAKQQAETGDSRIPL